MSSLHGGPEQGTHGVSCRGLGPSPCRGNPLRCGHTHLVSVWGLGEGGEGVGHGGRTDDCKWDARGDCVLCRIHAAEVLRQVVELVKVWALRAIEVVSIFLRMSGGGDASLQGKGMKMGGV
jgi:hypothetical protein